MLKPRNASADSGTFIVSMDTMVHSPLRVANVFCLLQLANMRIAVMAMNRFFFIVKLVIVMDYNTY